MRSAGERHEGREVVMSAMRGAADRRKRYEERWRREGRYEERWRVLERREGRCRRGEAP